MTAMFEGAQMRVRVLMAMLLVSGATMAFAQQQQTYQLTGIVSGRYVSATGQPSWLEGGFGRLDYGASATGDKENDTVGVAQLGLDWRPSVYFDVHVQGLARKEASGSGGRRAGVPEAYADLRTIFGNNQVQLRAGEFFIPTSRENTGPLWSSPYTITLSALNTWIAQEVRPIGADVEWRHGFASGSSFTLAGTAFQRNDAMGSELAWRGWSLGSRVSVYDEVLPLPPLFSLHDPNILGRQRADGTLPIGRDLDGRWGYSVRARFSLADRALIQVTRIDNRGDRAFYDNAGEYSWQTRVNIVSGELHPNAAATIAAEFANGSTGMGFAPNPFVQADLRTFYALYSQKSGNVRVSIRYDGFRTTDRDHSIAESNDENGHALTLATFYDLGNANSRLGVEYVTVTGQRPAATQSGFDGNTDGKSVIIEYRFSF